MPISSVKTTPLAMSADKLEEGLVATSTEYSAEAAAVKPNVVDATVTEPVLG